MTISHETNLLGMHFEIIQRVFRIDNV